MHPVIEDIDLGEILRGLVDQFSAVSESRGILLRLGPCRYSVRSDRRLLRRVLQNLISNALRYTERGSVLIGARRLPGGKLRVDIIDTGLGIPEESMSKVFEEFQRTGKGSPWGEKGLGLGLAICVRICSLLSHSLSVRSQLDHGSTFSVGLGLARRLPCGLESRAGIYGVAMQPRLNLTILCVDDEPDVRDAMHTLISGWGAIVITADSLATALQAARNKRPHVVLVDYQFDTDGSLNGLNIISALRDLYPAQPPVSILVTANRSLQVQTQAKALGVAVLLKPLKAMRLRALLDAATRQENPQCGASASE